MYDFLFNTHTTSKTKLLFALEVPRMKEVLDTLYEIEEKANHMMQELTREKKDLEQVYAQEFAMYKNNLEQEYEKKLNHQKQLLKEEFDTKKQLQENQYKEQMTTLQTNYEKEKQTWMEDLFHELITYSKL